MWAAWAITGGGFVAGLSGLLIRDHMIYRKRRGLPMVAGWVRKSGLALVIVVLVAAGLFIFAALARPRCTTSGRSVSRSNLSQLGKAMGMYAEVTGNQGAFPRGGASPTQSLWLLYPDYIDDRRVFWNPRNRGKRPAGIPRVCTDGCQPRIPLQFIAATDYVYLEGYKDTDGVAIVAYERLLYRGGRYVLRGAGSVEWMEDADFQEELATQFKAAMQATMAVHLPDSTTPKTAEP